MRSVTALAAIAVTAAATTAAAAKAATTTAAAAEAATTATAAEAAAWTLFLRTGLIDRELTAAELGAIDFFSRSFGLLLGSHGHEGEAAGAARHLVHGDIYVGHSAELPEVSAKLVLGGLKGQVSNVKFGISHLLIS
jgi:hypothetical protein